MDNDIVFYAHVSINHFTPMLSVNKAKLLLAKHRLGNIMIDDRVLDGPSILLNYPLFRTHAEALRHGIYEMRQKINGILAYINDLESKSGGLS
jgi:hypothetical protein